MMAVLVAGFAIAAISPVPLVQSIGVAMIVIAGGWYLLQHYVQRGTR